VYVFIVTHENDLATSVSNVILFAS
jgi:hypothetical protein